MANVAHSSLTGANQHEPKGADTATADQIYVSDGAGSGTWTDKATVVGSLTKFIGEPFLFAGTSAPNASLLCDGSAVSRTTYSALYAVIGDTFGEGNGSTTFNVPDMRGEFARGRDRGRGKDPDAATRTAMATGGNTGDAIGSVQGFALEDHGHDVTDSGHTHSYDRGVTGGTRASGSFGVNGPGFSTGTSGSSTTGVTIADTGSVNSATVASAETRPTNVAFDWYIYAGV